MKKSTPLSTFSASKIYCGFFGHDFVISKKITHHVKEYKCCNCGTQATTNSQGKLEIMTPKLKEINNTLAFVHNKKVARNARKIDLHSAS